VEFRNDTQMQNEVPNAGARSPNMSGLTEPEDPDYRVHAAWLAQASNAGDGPLPKEAAGGASELTSSLARPDRLGGQEAPLAPAQVDRRSGVIIFIGCIFGAAIAAVIAIPSYLSFFETPQQPTGDPIQLTSPDPVKSATPPMQNEAETPKLGANAWCSWRTCANRTSAAGAGQ
jgi:hypothetical protein